MPLREPQQPRVKRDEPEEFYDIVRRLRRSGCRVYRAGPRHSLVNGKRVSNDVLAKQWVHWFHD